MPELPEVETLARQLHPLFIGQALTGLWCNWPRMLSPRLRDMERRLVGAKLTGLTRRAKFLIWEFGPAGSLLIHLRMSGHPTSQPAGTPPAKHVHYILRFASGSEMHLDDTRKFA